MNGPNTNPKRVTFEGNIYVAAPVNKGCDHCDMFDKGNSMNCYANANSMNCWTTYKKIISLKKILKKL